MNRIRFRPTLSSFFSAALAAIASLTASQGQEVRSVVFSARSETAIENYQENPAEVRPMVDGLLLRVTGQNTAANAWRSLVKPGDKVGIKVAGQGGRLFSTHRGIVSAIADGLSQAGIPRKDIIVWDRSNLAEAGFTETSGYQVRGVEPVTGYNPKAVFNSPMIGRLIWGDLAFTRNKPGLFAATQGEPEQLSTESHWSNVASREVTKIINVPIMVNDESCGLAGALYNLTIPNLDNWRRFASGSGSASIGEIYADATLRPKVVLHIMDGLIAQYAGGPGFNPNYAFHHRTLYASKDPVALDSVALGKIQQWRSEAKLTKARGNYLEAAEAMGLGNFSPERIEIRECGTQAADAKH